MKRVSMLGAAGVMLAALPASAGTIVLAGAPGTTGATAYYATLPSEISASEVLTPAETASFLGAPDDLYTGLGSGFITYDFGTYRIVNGAGQDFNVYEYNTGSVEFNSADILVSVDGVTFFNVEATFGAAIDLAGDELHGSASFRRSYDLTGAVVALGSNQFRYLRLDGTSSGSINGSSGFDPDAVGLVNFVNTAQVGGIPEPTTWAFLIMGFGAVGGAMRARTTRVAYQA